MMKMLATTISKILKRLFPKRVSFSDGSYVEWFNREAILYVEPQGRAMEIPWYFLRGHLSGRVLQLTDISYWNAPHENEPLTPMKKEEIRSKIEEYSRRRNIPLKIE
jgi:hypothetical protein